MKSGSIPMREAHEMKTFLLKRDDVLRIAKAVERSHRASNEAMQWAMEARRLLEVSVHDPDDPRVVLPYDESDVHGTPVLEVLGEV